MNAAQSPMFQQYYELKAQQPDALLFFRMGDFYEMFFDDAVVGAQALELTLTSRNKNDEVPIPMAGLPHHAAAGYIQRLTDQGYRVAIAEQMEDPASAKGLVRRAITRVVTPGIPFDPTSLDARLPSWIAVICRHSTGYAVAWLDASTGDLRCTEVETDTTLVGEIHRFEPREALIQPGIDNAAITEALQRHRTVLSRVDASAWTLEHARQELESTLHVTDPSLAGILGEGALLAVGAALRYGRDTTGAPLGNLHSVRSYSPSGFMVIDDTSRRNLELTRTLLGGHRKGSLLGLIDRCATAMGARLLREWLAFPLLHPIEIADRQHAVGWLVDDAGRREDLRTALRHVADLERIGARVAQGTVSPRDLSALRRSLESVPGIVEPLRHHSLITGFCPADMATDITDDLQKWLVDEPPQTMEDGGVIRRGAHAALDEVTRLALDGLSLIQELEAREQAETGIASLKIRRNNVFGFFIEITRAQAHRVPVRYIRRQTLSTGERYITPELKELEEQVLGADERRVALEIKLFGELRERIGIASPRLLSLARSLAGLDVLGNLADVAVRSRWVRPEVDDRSRLDIRGGRHPVVEAMLNDDRFVSNDVQLDTELRRMVVLTGPNMAGKSTILRQTALIVLLAQIGSFVPADAAWIGTCDQIFTRVGAIDDLARGQSTFMVEMAETAAILHAATRKSLVILDEIGRGTSTYDGLSIAWAVAEDLAARIQCRAMFATHYHELCDLADQRDGVVNQSIAIHETGDRIVFLRKLKDGGASRSYGIQCARIAGLPAHVVARAQSMLRRFEKAAPRNQKNQLSLFGGAGSESESTTPTPEVAPSVTGPTVADTIRDRLAAIDADALTPRQAHEALYALKALLDGTVR